VLVVDTSAVMNALAAATPSPELLERLASDPDLHAPHLIDVEFLHALRRLCLSGDLSEDRATDVRTDFSDLAIVRYPHEELSDRIWELRQNLTAYDAAFVALAEALGAPLVTGDGKLAAAPGHGARVELFARPS
jgi:predicted nucleic acid-binding protein